MHCASPSFEVMVLERGCGSCYEPKFVVGTQPGTAHVVATAHIDIVYSSSSAREQLALAFTPRLGRIRSWRSAKLPGDVPRLTTVPSVETHGRKLPRPH